MSCSIFVCIRRFACQGTRQYPSPHSCHPNYFMMEQGIIWIVDKAGFWLVEKIGCCWNEADGR